jgi:hypothetical protein
MDSVERDRKEFIAKLEADANLIAECTDRIANVIIEYKGKTLSNDIIFLSEILINIIANTLVHQDDKLIDKWMDVLKIRTKSTLEILRKVYLELETRQTKETKNVDKAN